MSKTPLEVANQYVESYNAFDIDAVAALIADDAHFTHFGREFNVHGVDTITEAFRGTPAAIPDRQFVGRVDAFEVGDKAVVQHQLTGTPTVDLLFGPKGKTFTIDLCTVITVRDGKIVRYEDYG